MTTSVMTVTQSDNNFVAVFLENSYTNVSVPGTLVPSKMHKSKDKPFKVNSSAYGSTVAGHGGGGGDLIGTVNATMSLQVPQSLSRYFYSRPVVMVLTVQWTYAGNGPSMTNKPKWTLSLDTNTMLDYAIVLASRTLVTNTQTRVVMLRVWGFVKPYTPNAKITVKVYLDYITNNHNHNWDKFLAYFSVDLTVESSESRLRPSPVEVDGFELLMTPVESD